MSSSATFFIPAPSGTGSANRTVVRARRWIDAATGDYVVESGRLKQDDGFTSKAVLALRTKLGSCLAFPAFGSRLHEIRKADEQGRRLAEKFALMACAHLSAEVDDLKAVATLSERSGAIELVVSGRKGNEVLRAPYTAVVG
jgi:phage gp46-like protein